MMISAMVRSPYLERYPQYTTLPYPWQARFRLDSPRRRAL